MNCHLRGRFVGQPGQRLFLLTIDPMRQHRQRSTVLVIQPFGDELNKTRRSLACLGRLLALKGWTLAIIDLRGTGDSEGELATVRLSHWLEDVAGGFRYLERHGYDVRRVLAIRFGALLGCHEHILQAIGPEMAVLWEPVTEGNRALRQLLRLKVAADRFRGINTSVDALLHRIYEQGVLEVAGYELTAGFITDVMGAAVDLAEIATRVPLQGLSVSKLGFNSTTRKNSSSAMMKACVTGPRFWESVEITVAEEFIQQTVAQFPKVG
jgi:exosortase A-associated hydrolase 2